VIITKSFRPSNLDTENVADNNDNGILTPI